MIANFALPDFTQIKFYKNLHEEMINHREMYRENSRISCIYGNFFPSLWNGGRAYPSSSKFFWKEDIINIVKFCNEVMNLPLRLTFTNNLLTKEDCYDRYSNMIADICNNGLNEILTSSPILEEYLRNKYKNYKYCRSILASFDNDTYNWDDYYMVVINRKHNNDWGYLDKISNKSKCEFLLNERCPDNCPYYGNNHYHRSSESILNFSKNEQPYGCLNKENYQYRNSLLNQSTITRKDIDTKYLPKSFNQFKIEGRYNILATAKGIADYLAKEEFRDTVFCRVLDFSEGGR